MSGARRFAVLTILVSAAACRPDSHWAFATSDQGSVPTDVRETLDSLYEAADSLYFEEADYDRAEALFSEALRLSRDRGTIRDEAEALTKVGLAAYRQADYDRARAILEESLELKLQHDIADELVSSYNALGLLAYNENRFGDGMIRLRAAGAEAERAGDRYGYGVARGNLGLILLELGQFEEARELLDEMRQVMEELVEAGGGPNPTSAPRTLGTAVLNLGVWEVRVGNPEAGAERIREALEIFRRLPYATGESYALGHLGTAFLAMGDATRAFAVLDTALLLSREQGERQDEASNLEILAEQYRAAGDHLKALELYGEARLINEERGLDVETGTDLRGEAEIYRELGDPEHGVTLVSEALGVHQAAGARLEELFDLLLLAELQDETGRRADADVSLGSARALAEQLHVRSARVAAALSEARVALKRGSPGDALSPLDRIDDDVRFVGYAAEAEARLLRGRALRLTDDLEGAATAGWLALAAVERVRDTYESDVLRTSFTSVAADIYTDLMSVLIDLGRVDEAFGVADAARGRAVSERVARALDPDGRSAADAVHLLLALEQTAAQIDTVERLSEGGALAPDDFLAERALLEERLDSLRSAFDSVSVQASTSWPAGRLDPGRARAVANRVRASLTEGQLLLSYHVPSEGPIRIFAVTPTEVRVLTSPLPPERLASRIRLARDLISRRDRLDAGSHPVFTGLFEALLGPVAAGGTLAEAREVIVVPHGVLTYLPFAALRDPKTDRYLVEDLDLRMSPSGALLGVLAGKGAQGIGPGGAAFAPLPEALPGSEGEAEAVAAALESANAFVGPSATEAALRHALVSGVPVHVASHGRMNASNPLFSRVEMAPGVTAGPADDGALEVHEVLELDVRSPLVFLSGCETALSRAGATRFSPGEDLASLSTAFLLAGARNIVATLWPIADDGAAAFAARFYHHLSRSPPAAALAAAQRDLLADAAYSAPYYWAAYQVTGDDRIAPSAQNP